jgi:hypothetical protein
MNNLLALFECILLRLSSRAECSLPERTTREGCVLVVVELIDDLGGRRGPHLTQAKQRRKWVTAI